MISNPVISERRAAAARANGAKSRGPVTARGKAISSANSFRHGLRSQIIFDDPEFHEHQAAVLNSYREDLQPQSQLERTLVDTLAFCHSRRTRLSKLETAILNQAMRQSELVDGPAPPSVRAFRALRNKSSAFELLNRLEGRFERQFTRAFAEFNELRASGSLHREANIDERTHQVIENTATGPTEPEPQHSTGSERQTNVDRPSASPPRNCILQARKGLIAAHDPTKQTPRRQPRSKLRFAGGYLGAKCTSQSRAAAATQTP